MYQKNAVLYIFRKFPLCGLFILCVTSCGHRENQAEEQTGSQAKLISEVNRRHDLSEDLRAPGLTEASYMGRIALSSVVSNAISKRRTALVLRNESEAFSKETDPLKEFSRKDADCITIVSLVRFPITDKMLEPLHGKKLTELEITQSSLSDLHALKDMTTLEVANLSENPLNSKGIQVVSTLLNLRKLDLSSTPLKNEDLLFLYNLKRLKKLKLTSCAGVSEAAVERIKKALPNCKIRSVSHKRTPGEKLLDLARQTSRDGDVKSAAATVSKLIGDLAKSHSDDYLLVSKCHQLLGDCFTAQHDKDRASAEYLKAAQFSKRVEDSEPNN